MRLSHQTNKLEHVETNVNVKMIKLMSDRVSKKRPSAKLGAVL